MKFDLRNLNPLAWPWKKWGAALGAGFGPAQNFLVSNRNAVLSTAMALLIGLWGGAVLAQGGAGGSSGSALLPSFSFGTAAGVRAANAPRAGTASVEGMGFVRLRAETDSAEPRACLEFSRDLSTDPSVHYSDYLKIDPVAPVQTEVSGNLLCLGGLPLEPERQVTILAGLPAANGEKTSEEETFTLSFGDRPAYVGFAGSGVILPRAEADGVAIETVNVSKIEIEVLRVPERILTSAKSIQAQARKKAAGARGSSMARHPRSASAFTKARSRFR